MSSEVKLEFGPSKLTVNLYGATITSWEVDIDGKIHSPLFLSKKAILDGSKAIRGGIPLVFPVFGASIPAPNQQKPMPQHGFARIRQWKYEGIKEEVTGSHLTAHFHLETGDTVIQSMWPFKVLLKYNLTLHSDGSLETCFEVENIGEQDCKFQSLLHTYFAVDDISKVRVSGLSGDKTTESGCLIRDKLKDDGANLTKLSAELCDNQIIDQEVDRVFVNCLQPKNPSLQRNTSPSVKVNSGDITYEIRTNGFKDCVVWNPWVEKSKRMSDFADDEFQKMICAEVGWVEGFIELKKGCKWSGSQVLTLRK